MEQTSPQILYYEGFRAHLGCKKKINCDEVQTDLVSKTWFMFHTFNANLNFLKCIFGILCHKQPKMFSVYVYLVGN